MLRSLIVLFCLTFSFLGTLSAQEVVELGGKKYIIHKVEKGNTLYAISRTYSVQVSDILLENPELASGLKIGQEIKVPVNGVDKKEAKNSPELQNGFLIHKVDKKETLYSISKEYGVSIKTIYESNEGLQQGGLKEGTEIKIPTNISKNVDAAALNPPKEAGKKYHTVQRKETLYGLSRKFGVEVKDLKEANGGLPEGLKVGQEIVIPPANKTAKQTEQSNFTPKAYVDQSSSASKSILNSSSELESGEEVNIALFLPFNLESLNGVNKLGHNQVALEFYQGAKIALDSLQQLGLKVKLHVYDTKKSAATVRQILAKPELAKMNLLIGPLYKSCFLEAAKFSNERGIPLVNPVPQSNKILQSNPLVSKVYCSDATQARWAGAYVRKTFEGANVLVMRQTTEDEKRLSNFFEKAAMFRSEDTLQKIIFWDKKFDVDKVKRYLDPVRENIIYVPSNDISFVMNAITNLTPLAEKFKIHLVGNEDWLKMEQVETGDFAKLHTTMPVSSYTNYKAENVKQFLRQYRSLYNTDPNQYGLLGFDVMYYYMLGYLKYGGTFATEFQDVVFEPTSVRFRMKRIIDGSGFENTGVYILEFDENYELNPVY